MGPELNRLVDAYVKAEKEGRVLSSKNSTKLRDAMAALHEVLTAAGLMEEDTKDTGEKCMDSMPISVVETSGPYGGAKSFADLDDFMDATEEQRAIRYTMACAQELMNNIMRDDDLDASVKGEMLQTLASELPNRISEPPDYAYKEEGMFARVRSAIFGSKTIKKEGKKFVLYSKDGSKKLGEFDSEDEATKREGQANFFKKKDDGTFLEERNLRLPINVAAQYEIDAAVLTDDLFEELFGEKHPGHMNQSVHGGGKGGGKGPPKMSAGGEGRVQRGVAGKPNAGDEAHYKKRADTATKKAKKRRGAVATSRTSPAYDKKEVDDLMDELVGV